ncbi:MAG: vanadium-dependent haloperoxidase [Proteobacteria bacterium]|nr:vanadium-dependent haloperoxidase [Pseudomonadota bacterium]
MRTFRYLLFTLTVTLGLAGASPAGAQNAIVSWHAVMETSVAGSGRKNAVALPYYAYVDVAMYDAVSAIDHRLQPFAVEVAGSRGASEDAAAASAAHDVLVHYLPAQTATFDAALASSLAAIPDGQSKTDGIHIGQAVAAQWLALRAGDGLEVPIVYTPGHGPGIWEQVPTYPAPPPNTPPPPVAVWLAHFKPFAMTSADQFLADIPPPPSLTSPIWTINFNLTKAYGAQNSTVRTPAQTEIGRFWTDDAAAQYSRAFRGLVASQRLGTAAAARLGAMYTVAAADAVTACFNAKYHFAFWRPYTAIHDADTDGNPNTVPDPNWVPLAVTPGHPEYPAAHGCVTEAVMDALTAYFEDDEVPYSVNSVVTGTTHSFNSFEDVVAEVDNARVYGGMHYRHSVKEGNRLGRMVTEYMLRNHFRMNDD